MVLTVETGHVPKEEATTEQSRPRAQLIVWSSCKEVWSEDGHRWGNKEEFRQTGRRQEGFLHMYKFLETDKHHWSGEFLIHTVEVPEGLASLLCFGPKFNHLLRVFTG